MRLVIVPAALAELQDVVEFYALQANLELAKAFVDEFDRAIQLILLNPQLGVIFRGSRPRYFLRRFPYNIIYQVTVDELRVVAVAHQRRRPAYWRGRK